MKITLIHKDGRQREIPVRDTYGCVSFHNLDEIETIIVDSERCKGGPSPIHFMKKEEENGRNRRNSKNNNIL